MGSLAGSIRAWDGWTRTSTDEHGQTGDGVWYFARPSGPKKSGLISFDGRRQTPENASRGLFGVSLGSLRELFEVSSRPVRSLFGICSRPVRSLFGIWPRFL